jgi:hypothetical protein
MKRPTKLQLAYLGELAMGGMITGNNGSKGFWLNGREVSYQTVENLKDQRLIRVYDPNRKSGTAGNGFIISEKGLAALQAGGDALNASPTSTEIDDARRGGLAFPDDVSRAELHALTAEHRRRLVADRERRIVVWFVRSVWRDLKQIDPGHLPPSCDPLIALLLNDPSLFDSVKRYRATSYYPSPPDDEPLMEFGWADSRRTLAYEYVANALNTMVS